MKNTLAIILAMIFCFISLPAMAEIGVGSSPEQTKSTEVTNEVINKEENPAADFKLVDLRGNITEFSYLSKGNKPTLLVFSHPSCLSCWIQGVFLNAFAKKHSNEITIVNVWTMIISSQDEDFVEGLKLGYDFSVYTFPDKATVQEAMNQYVVISFPYIVFIKDGSVVSAEPGSKLLKQLEELTGVNR